MLLMQCMFGSELTLPVSIAQFPSHFIMISHAYADVVVLNMNIGALLVLEHTPEHDPLGDVARLAFSLPS